MRRETHTNVMPRPSQATVAATCPGCGLPILFDPAELTDSTDPALRDVMCAWCGTVTGRRLLAAEAHDPARVNGD
jgi:hypothetical protein